MAYVYPSSRDDADSAAAAAVRQDVLNAYGVAAWQVGLAPVPWRVRIRARCRRCWHWATRPVRPRHVHCPFRCPAHVGGCECLDMAYELCNPYHVAGWCPDRIDVIPVAPVAK